MPHSPRAKVSASMGWSSPDRLPVHSTEVIFFPLLEAGILNSMRFELFVALRYLLLSAQTSTLFISFQPCPCLACVANVAALVRGSRRHHKRFRRTSGIKSSARTRTSSFRSAGGARPRRLQLDFEKCGGRAPNSSAWLVTGASTPLRRRSAPPRFLYAGRHVVLPERRSKASSCGIDPKTRAGRSQPCWTT